jgi:hypothetical protein
MCFISKVPSSVLLLGTPMIHIIKIAIFSFHLKVHKIFSSSRRVTSSRRLKVILKLRNWPRGVYATSAGNSYRLHHCCWHITTPSWQNACYDVVFSIAARIVGSGHASISDASIKLRIPRWGPEVVSSILEKVNQDKVRAWDDILSADPKQWIYGVFRLRGQMINTGQERFLMKLG